MTATARKPAEVTAEEAKVATINANNRADDKTGVKCELDGVWVHSVSVHLRHNHPSTSLSSYRMQYPGAEIESAYFKELRASKNGAKAAPTAPAPVAEEKKVVPFPVAPGVVMTALSTVFDMPASAAFLNGAKKPVVTAVFPEPSKDHEIYMAEVDTNYVFEAEELREINLALFLNIPALLWGFHGTGKTTLIEQFVARTRRPWIRVQHTVSTEEAHILGQYVVKPNPEGEGNIMVFEPGPLAVAMREGFVYVADEYDFALPSVTSVYQPVLEGKTLLIKEAPPEWRMVKPHPNFRFFATGNTNGSGDESGLYQGTQIMNAANYSRFGVTMQVKYREPDVETVLVAKQSGATAKDARLLVNFATNVREAYEKGDISATVSSRELINAARIGVAKAGDFRAGIRAAYANRLNATDRKAIEDFAQRIFGGE